MSPKPFLLTGSILAFSLAMSAQPQAVRIIGLDYAFQLPERISAGETIMTFENKGAVRHELSLALIKAGFNVDSVRASVQAGSPKRNWMDGQAALIVSRPTDKPGPGIWIQLVAGRDYLLMCTLRDAADAPPHVVLGMVNTFHVN